MSIENAITTAVACLVTLFVSHILRTIRKNRENVKLQGPNGQTVWITRTSDAVIEKFKQQGFKVVN